MKRFLLIFWGLVFVGAGFSQTTNPIRWDYAVNIISNCDAEIVITARMEKGWHLYSQKHVNGVPLVFDFEPSTYFTKVGTVIEPEPFKEYDDIFAYDVFYFKESEVVFKQKIKINSTKPVSVGGTITGQVCQYETGICMPINLTFSFNGPKCP